MKEFKGTKGSIELKYVNDICIGIGTVGNYSQITANSILPDTAEEYKNEREEIEANMQLYASAHELLEALQYFNNGIDHFYKRIDFGRSNLDAKAIEFMNESNILIRKAIEKALK